MISLYSSLVQLTTSDAMRGRVMSIFMLAFRGGMPLGNLIAGYVAQRWSITAALGRERRRPGRRWRCSSSLGGRSWRDERSAVAVAATAT